MQDPLPRLSHFASLGRGASLRSSWLTLALSLLLSLSFSFLLSYQEQNQLFLWTSDYLLEALSTPGGFARYLAEFIVQFYYIPWLGALLFSLVFGLLAFLLSRLFKGWWRLLTIPAVLFVLWQMGDEAMTLTYPVALVMCLLLFHVMRRVPVWFDFLVYLLFFWVIGPLVVVYGILRIGTFDAALQRVKKPWSAKRYLRGLILPLLLEPFLLAWLFPRQCPMQAVTTGLWYSRYPQWAITGGYDRDRYELIRQDYLIRNERWTDLIERAEKHTVETPFWSESVNLALAMNGQLPYRQFDFFQSGHDGLIMNMVRDQTSNLPSMEAFYRLGMTNECLRYAFDLQESIPMGRRSGRLTQRIVECYIVKGQYEMARQHLRLLKHTLFYRSWAEEAESYLGDEARINAHPVWGAMRRHAFQHSFLYFYPNLAKIFYDLFLSDTSNHLAMQYMYAQILLDGNDYVFGQMIGFVQQYGNYPTMPPVYEDAWQCMHGAASPTSRYAEYAARVMSQQQPSSQQESSH